MTLVLTRDQFGYPPNSWRSFHGSWIKPSFHGDFPSLCIRRLTSVLFMQSAPQHSHSIASDDLQTSFRSSKCTTVNLTLLTVRVTVALIVQAQEAWDDWGSLTVEFSKEAGLTDLMRLRITQMETFTTKLRFFSMFPVEALLCKSTSLHQHPVHYLSDVFVGSMSDLKRSPRIGEAAGLIRWVRSC